MSFQLPTWDTTMNKGEPSLSKRIAWILYHDDSAAIPKLLQTRKEVPIEQLMDNKRIIQLFAGVEPGPSIDYNRLKITLDRFRCYINTFEPYEFFQKLFLCRDQWLTAAVRLEAYIAFGNTLTEQLKQHGQAPNPALVQAYFMPKLNQFQADLDNRMVALVNLKRSDEMWKNSSILWQGIELYQKYHKAAETKRIKAEADKERAKENQIRRMGAKQRNESVARRQLGPQLNGDIEQEELDTIVEIMGAWADSSILDNGEGEAASL